MRFVPSPLLPLTHSGGQAALLKCIVTIPINRNQIRFPVGDLSSASNVIANVPYKLVALSSVEDYVPGFSKAAGMPSASGVMALIVLTEATSLSFGLCPWKTVHDG